MPLIGNLHQADTARVHLAVEDWGRRYGPLFRFRLGRRDLLGVTDPLVVSALLRDRPEGWRRTRVVENLLRELGVGGVFAANGDVWRAQRRMVMAAFDTRHLKQYYPFVARVAERFHRRWSQHAKEGRVFDLQADLMRFTVDVVAGLALGLDVNTIETPGETLQTHMNHIFPMLARRLNSPLPYWRWLKLPADRRLDHHVEHLRRAVAEVIAAARGRLDADPSLRESPENLIEAMLVERERPGTTLDDHDVASNVVTMLLAGEDTTAHTLAWLIHLASRDSDVMRRLTAEADQVLGDTRYAERLEVASALRYTGACAQETMRLKPVAPLLFIESVVPCVVGDVAVPAGTVVAGVMRSGSQDPRWFERPEVFDPGRWLAAPGGATPGASGERISMPFGAGPRICPGRNLALLEINVVTSLLFRNFKIASLDTADGSEVRECLAFTMAPSPLRMTLVHRSGDSEGARTDADGPVGGSAGARRQAAG